MTAAERPTSTEIRTNFKTIRQLVTDELRKLLLTGSFKPGEKLDENELANLLGVSRQPIRLALRQLTSEGLVEAQPYKGAVVVRLTAEDIEDIYDLRVSLEGQAAQLAVTAITPEHCARLKRFVEEMAEAAQRGDYASFHQLNNAFHLALYETCNRKRLFQIVRDLRAQSALAMNTYLLFPSAANRALREHEQILAACERHDADEAERLTREHLGRTARVLLDLVRGEPSKE
ncbi:MAG: GntR family transcriptional regulator [Ardenticatenaceae bacterium]|nr:GntR family transcriptional regulator [Ardenticatenaceae bacterium]